MAQTGTVAPPHVVPVAGPKVATNNGLGRLPRVCIIGAGCSGFTTAKRLQDNGIPFVVYEASDDIGGN